MQDSFVGDIGDYGKYGLLRKVQGAGFTLGINWYRVHQKNKSGQDDGKYIHYLSEPEKYRRYDVELFDSLRRIVIDDCDRRIERIEQSGLLQADFYNQPIPKERSKWHELGMKRTEKAQVVFLDPDNGLETERMFESGRCGPEYVSRGELLSYYKRGQSVILYQHRPQMMKKADCVQRVLQFQRARLEATAVLILEFPKYTNRYYFMFLHERDIACFRQICVDMSTKWKGFCNLCPSEQLIL